MYSSKNTAVISDKFLSIHQRRSCLSYNCKYFALEVAVYYVVVIVPRSTGTLVQFSYSIFHTLFNARLRCIMYEKSIFLIPVTTLRIRRACRHTADHLYVQRICAIFQQNLEMNFIRRGSRKVKTTKPRAVYFFNEREIQYSCAKKENENVQGFARVSHCTGSRKIAQKIIQFVYSRFYLNFTRRFIEKNRIYRSWFLHECSVQYPRTRVEYNLFVGRKFKFLLAMLIYE